jgi:3-methyladenine DNA glycosylase/8-oxoguanine DNA glycosylase
MQLGDNCTPVMQPRIDDDLKARAVRALRRRDPRLADLIRQVGPCRIELARDPYRELVRSVVYQQLAGAAAGAIFGRLKARHRGRVPRPEGLLESTEAELRADGLSRQKIAAVRAVATAFADGHVSNRRLRAMDDQAVIDAVTQIRGIGEWTAHMLMMFSLGRPDVLPFGDYGVRQGARIVYELDELPNRKALESLAECWRPYRSIGAWYLWRATEL